ncbi:ComF family protein [uncultured Tyzzerella sp.]|uniref:ComF family protein n=1 Tax=uncultured Tyzzerella sp. TaxID=2321398 RepID=UPI002941EAA8|nr:ComF family protein [uncultured Tyzzerella sp.]
MFLKIFNKILDFIYPNKCVFCEEIIPLNEDDSICKYCYMNIDFITDDKEPNLSVFCYDDVTRFSILRLKYNNMREYSKVFAKMMYNKLSKIDIKKYDYIICVPMYFKKKKKRGYDQAELIAEELSKLCNIPIQKENLIRNKNTLAQSKVSFDERGINVKGVFEVLNTGIIKDKNILLIDDIYTTGSTINNCGKVLREAGANNICYFTLAKVVHKEDFYR